MSESWIVLALAHLERRRQQTSGTDHPTPADHDPAETKAPGSQTAWPHRGDLTAAPLWAAIVLLVVLAVLTVLVLGPRVAIGQEWYDRNPFDPPTFELQSGTGTIDCLLDPTVQSKIGTWKYHSCYHATMKEHGYCMNLAPITGALVGAGFYCQKSLDDLDRWVNEVLRQ